MQIKYVLLIMSYICRTVILSYPQKMSLFMATIIVCFHTYKFVVNGLIGLQFRDSVQLFCIFDTVTVKLILAHLIQQNVLYMRLIVQLRNYCYSKMCWFRFFKPSLNTCIHGLFKRVHVQLIFKILCLKLYILISLTTLLYNFRPCECY